MSQQRWDKYVTFVRTVREDGECSLLVWADDKIKALEEEVAIFKRRESCVDSVVKALADIEKERIQLEQEFNLSVKDRLGHLRKG